MIQEIIKEIETELGVSENEIKSILEHFFSEVKKCMILSSNGVKVEYIKMDYLGRFILNRVAEKTLPFVKGMFNFEKTAYIKPKL
jgi:nucleoid DNA-binding protein